MGNERLDLNKTGDFSKLESVCGETQSEKKMVAKELYESFKTQIESGKYTHQDDAKALAGVQLADVKLRILMERAIIRALVTELLKVGANIRIDNGEYTIECTTLAETMSEIQATDEETLRVEIDGRKGVYDLAYGNDGYDVICDWSLWLEGLEFSNKISELQDGFADEVYKEAKK